MLGSSLFRDFNGVDFGIVTVLIIVIPLEGTIRGWAPLAECKVVVISEYNAEAESRTVSIPDPVPCQSPIRSGSRSVAVQYPFRILFPVPVGV